MYVRFGRKGQRSDVIKPNVYILILSHFYIGAFCVCAILFEVNKLRIHFKKKRSGFLSEKERDNRKMIWSNYHT